MRSPLSQDLYPYRTHFSLAIASNSKPIPDRTLILALRSPLIQNLYPDLTLILALRSPLSQDLYPYRTHFSLAIASNSKPIT
ncbi:MAG: hypothetical protein KA717_05880 [Woronichinia naegeliana WA131]|uniref:Uncharacterized protein n=1 Tax=Woronichinia naegeliana WA131 TaxID=2824559 RepID=A0A977L0F6_9CYAN|nr:MAG: hypothetical protein KA717_05880 [Woronichinia naegeliana WA131]